MAVTFPGGVAFSFTDGTIYTLASGGRLLLVRNPEAFAIRHGVLSNIAGAYSSSLSNGGGIAPIGGFIGKRVV
ncbi:MAG: hypothetical protein EXS36_16125 [Pedosphaera sp.]|nr:hypothetical protein [Pedosphaera sp.]